MVAGQFISYMIKGLQNAMKNRVDAEKLYRRPKDKIYEFMIGVLKIMSLSLFPEDFLAGMLQLPFKSCPV